MMRCLNVVLLLLGLASVSSGAAASYSHIDWSKVRPVEELHNIGANLLRPLEQTRPDRRVVNGYEATPGQFPYQVALLGQFDLGIGLCGASVITQNYVLTAAHCVYNSNDTQVPIVGGTAILGAHNRIEEEPTQQRITFTSSGIIGHPDYRLLNVRNDIALVRLDEPIVYTDRIQPIRLPARSDTRQFAGLIGTVSGYGIYDSANPRLSDVLNYVSNPIITNAACVPYFNPGSIEPQNLCHSGEGGRAACNSDSGGPLTVNDNGASLQVGVVSFGSFTGCDTGYPTVYARVTYYLGWIEANSDFVADP